MTVATDNALDSPQLITGDLSEVAEKLDELKEVLSEEKEPEKILVDDKEMTANEVLVEIMQKVEPDLAQKDLTNDMAATQLATLDDLLLATQNLLEKTDEQNVLLDQQQQLQIESTFFVSLSIVISFAVYMLWSQLSKW